MKTVFGSETFFEIRYEDLIFEPQKISKNICDFLNVEYDENMILSEKFKDDQGKNWEPNTSFEAFHGFNDKSLSKFKDLISNEEQDFIEKYLYEEISNLNYPLYGNLDISILDYQKNVEKLRKSAISVSRYKIALLVSTLDDKNSKDMARLIYQNGNELIVFTNDDSTEDDFSFEVFNFKELSKKANVFDFIHIHGYLGNMNKEFEIIKNLNYKIFGSSCSTNNPDVVRNVDLSIAKSENDSLELQKFLPKSQIKIYDDKELYERIQLLYRTFVIHNILNNA